MADFLGQVPTHELGEASFATYTAHDIRKLSVLEINVSQSFDALGHPTKGGLHDPKLGPTEGYQVCASCGQSSVRCMGHMGHIELPVPVFNPLFLRETFKLLKGACFSCHRFRANPAVCRLTLAQLRALNVGLVTTAKEMEMAFGEMLAEDDDTGKLNQDVFSIKEKLDEMLNRALKGIDSETAAKEAVLKNVLECRNEVTKTFIRDHINAAPRKCFHCQTTKQNLALEHETRIIIGPKSKRNIRDIKKTEKSQAFDLDEFGGMEVDENEQEDDEEENTVFKQVYLTPKEAREHLQKVLKKERSLVIELLGGLCGNKGLGDVSPIDGLFLDVLPVSPSRFRPVNRMDGEQYENQRSTVLNKVIQDSTVISHLLFALKSGSNEFSEDLKNLLSKLHGKTIAEKLQSAWFNLQSHVNTVYDGNLDKLSVKKVPGIKQILERKEGLFRMHMMGKRVNYAARSVISPDPYIDVDEIGVPEIFAKKLTYPQPVTPWNIKEVRQSVCNGPDEYPGATHVINEDGSKTVLTKQRVQREAIAKQLLKPCLNSEFVGRCKIVYRHLRNGDILLLNRQPSLHKPSIMAHKARIIPGEKTLRLNYSNCKSYNADFDGDEMNAHLPQSEVARAEAYSIANVNNQYLVPKDGTPLGGLIQDHIIGATLLMIRGMFFNREDYQHFVFGALARKEGRIRLLPPAIRKPLALWSGKQVVSTVIINTIPEGKHLLSLEGKSKIPIKCWQKQRARPWLAGGTMLQGLQMSESEVVIRQGELLCGILDKAHVGPTPYSMIHCCYELYGGDVSGQLLSQLARLFTHFLRIQGFTLGVEDILVTPKADRKRSRIMERARKLGDSVACEALELPADSTDKAALNAKMAEAHLGQDDRPMKELDLCMKVKTDGVNNDINKLCLPDGLLKKFPDNHLQLMVLSGAKGATVNCMQISCLLGQIELEGRRPPLMMSGSSLPSFQPYDTSPRAGGFVDGRFLTGIRPQEYFFHCMAGREGLIDTAVKTSRSGYLQHCLIKHLEGLVVAYDLSVRDSDGSIIQFQYGEDALDIPKLPFLKEEQFPFLEENANAIEDKLAMARVLQNCDYKDVLKKSKKIRRWLGKNDNEAVRNRPTGFLKFSEFNLPELKQKYPGFNPVTQRAFATEKIIEMWIKMDETEKKLYNDQLPKAMDPISSCFRPDTNLGAISENLDHLIESYLAKRPAGMKMSARDFRKMMHHKIMRSICEPGESIGILAAQSIGEPSTQMTLNTFHFAGRGEMNVTLGIPRLNEILKTASAKIATPSLEVPFLPLKKLAKKADSLRRKLSCVYLSDVIKEINIRDKRVITKSDKYCLYTIRFNFFEYKNYKGHLHVTPDRILKFMEKVFFKHLMHMIKLKIRIMDQSTLVSSISVRENSGAGTGGGDDAEKPNEKEDANNGESSDDENGEGDATSTKYRSRHDQNRDYEEEDEEEKRIKDEGIESGNEDVDETKTGNESSRSSTPVNEDSALDTKPVIESENKKMFSDLDGNYDSRETDRCTAERVANVIDSNAWIRNYTFDTMCGEWCELTMGLDILLCKVDLSEILKEEVKKALVHHTKGIKKAFVVEQKNQSGKTSTVLKTDGVNIAAILKYEHLLDLRRVYSNDIHAIAHTYGIEMAARIIVKEIQNVFRVYGIEVDPRHLLLVADYMTYHGVYRPVNRSALESNASPLLQMSFETTMNFLKMAIVSGQPDKLNSPSARIVMGLPVVCGTGNFALITEDLRK